MNHLVLKFLALTAALELNNKHNQQMLADGHYIPWWKRHLLLVIFIALMLPSILVGGFIVAVNVADPSAGTLEAFGTFLGWAIPVALIAGSVIAYRQAEKRWRSNAGTTIVKVRRGHP